MSTKYVKGEFRGDASTATAIALKDGNGVAIAAIATNESLAIYEIEIVTLAAQLVEVFSDNNTDGVVDAGERLFGGDFGANGGLAKSLHQPRYGKRGIIPKVKAATSSAVTVTINGMISKI